MAKRDIYIAIMVAAAKGQGVHLSADEVFDLSNDDAIATRASNGLDAGDWPEHKTHDSPGWAGINPRRARRGDNLAMNDPTEV